MKTTIYAGKTVYNLGPISRLPIGEGRAFQISDTTIAVFRTREGNIYATQSSCPHRGGPLADGVIGAGKVICPLHAYSFDLTSGEPVGNTCGALRTYPVSLNEADEILLVLDV